MKHYARIFLITLALMLLSVWASADTDSHTLSIQRLLINNDGSISMIIHTSAKGEIPASGFSLLVGGTDVAVNEVESYKRTDRGTTFLVLSDVSTIGATKGVKAIASGVIDQMDSDDNVGLLVNGYTSEQITVSDRALELKNLIDGDLFKRNTNAKNLNETAGIALDFLNQHNTVKPRACLVLLSTGENKDQSGITTDELRQKISDSGVTVYTVTFRNEKPTNQINTFESLARASCGGTAISIRYSPTEKHFSDALSLIQDQEAQFRLLTFSPGTLVQAGSEISLTLKDGDYTLTDTTTLSAAEYAQYQEVLAAQTTPTPTASPTVAPTTTPVPTPNKLFPAIAVAGGIVVIGLIVLLSRKRKTEPKDNEPQDSDTDVVPEPEPEPEPDPEPEPLVTRKPALHVKLVSEASDARCYEGNMDHTMLIGRDPQRVDIVMNSQDTTISGIHLRLTYRDGVMTAQDVSRNGTYMNNVRMTSPTVLQQHALLTLGRTPVRITWYPNQR